MRQLCLEVALSWRGAVPSRVGRFLFERALPGSPRLAECQESRWQRCVVDAAIGKEGEFSTRGWALIFSPRTCGLGGTPVGLVRLENLSFHRCIISESKEQFLTLPVIDLACVLLPQLACL